MGAIGPEMAIAAKNASRPTDTAMSTRIIDAPADGRVEAGPRCRPGSRPHRRSTRRRGPLPRHIQIATSAMTAAPTNAQTYRP
ncbi:MAG TPA: hypothetical protein DCG14_04250 [Phycisphaerales bacterium]|nr:hypothetical protein [Phycisphaerales bacterium]